MGIIGGYFSWTCALSTSGTCRPRSWGLQAGPATRLGTEKHTKWETDCLPNDISPRDPKQGERRKSVNLIKFDHFFDFSPKWSWGPLDRLKILSWSPLKFSTIENSILSFAFSSILDPDRPLAHFSLGPPWPRPVSYTHLTLPTTPYV